MSGLNDDLSLKKSKEFNSVYKQGKSYVTKNIVMYWKQNNEPYNRIGCTVSKKVGNAVTRNRVKRLMKETYRLNSNRIPKGYDLVFVARVRMKDANYAIVEKTMRQLLGRLTKG